MYSNSLRRFSAKTDVAGSSYSCKYFVTIKFNFIFLREFLNDQVNIDADVFVLFFVGGKVLQNKVVDKH
jgi:hypothetical protein